MSFILDALKKSEAERKRQDAPGIASIPAPTDKSSGAKWTWIIAALLTINVIALTVVVVGPGGETPAGNATVARPVAEEAAAQESVPTPVVDSATPAGALPVAAVEEPATPTTAAPANVRPSQSDGDVTAAPAAAATGPSELPTFDELRSAGSLQLPDLHVDIHVYSGQPADRFVFVNMTKYRENAKLAEGPVVTRITPDGVEMDYLGTAFLLPRE